MKKFLKKMTNVTLTFFMLFSSCNIAFVGQTVFAQDNEVITNSQVGENYYGFELNSVKEETKTQSTVMMFTHVKTGAKLMYIKNDDTQRVFDISFRTPATDNTGVNHIIEHSVLDGSKNYNVKSPFKEMLKSSLGSFINAMTSQDYTTFPVASTNEQDLKNLMGVYLDAVFYPNLISDPNIFKQEAWRYELPTKDSNLSINGVVYNEMKGNYSNPQWILRNATNQSLFPDASYKFESGGKPEDIPSLTREQLISTYKKNYTPSNSYIYLYGKLDIEEYLKFIDNNYLSKFDKSDVDTTIKTQEPLSNIPVKEVTYAVSDDSDTKKKTYLSLNFVTGNIDDKETNTALSFLSYLLMGTDNAPLKKALIDSGISENVKSSFTMIGGEPIFSIIASNCDEEAKEIFEKTIFNTLNDISKNGFDKDFIKSAISSYGISDSSEKLIMPILGGTGFNLSQTALATWIYDKDPTMYFETDSVMKKIMESDQNEYFKNLINKCLTSNDYHSLVVLKPEKGLETRVTQSTAKKLENYKNEIGQEGVNSLVKDTENFNAWQKSEDSKEAIENLPKLSLKDIKPELPNLDYQIDQQSHVKVLTHNTDLNGLANINFYFDTSRVPQDKLHYLTLLSCLLGNVDTKKHNYEELSNEMLQYIGGPITFTPSAVANSKNPDEYSPKMTASLLVPENNISRSFDIFKEIINSSQFKDKQKVKQIIEQNKSSLQMILTSGTGVAANLRMNSYMTESGRYNEELAGNSFCKFLQDLSNNFDEKWDSISKNLEDTRDLVFNRDELIVSCSGNEDSVKIFKDELNRIIPEIDPSILPQQKYNFARPEKNTAFTSAAKVQTVMQTGDLKKAGYTYSGKMMVLQNVLNNGYLWNKVRTTGGAYGVQSSFSTDGRVMLASMRDPNLKETLEAFKGSVDYLKNFKATDSEMENYIIGAVKEYVNLKNSGPLIESSLCDSMYLTNSSPEDLLQVEKQALSTTEQDIRNYANMLDEIIKQNIYFVEGSRDKIEQNSQLFNQIIDTEK
jgi:Zn-dependent M16 (insulinase) family peptidase